MTQKEIDLISASENGDIEKVRELLKSGVNPNVKDEGETPLMLAAIHGHVEIAEMLLGACANPDEQDNEGRTALLWSGYKEQHEVAWVLLDYGANPKTENNNGFDAWRYFKISPIMLYVLERHPSNVDSNWKPKPCKRITPHA